MKNTKLFLVVIAFMLSLVLAACGGEEPPTSDVNTALTGEAIAQPEASPEIGNIVGALSCVPSYGEVIVPDGGWTLNYNGSPTTFSRGTVLILCTWGTPDQTDNFMIP